MKPILFIALPLAALIAGAAAPDRAPPQRTFASAQEAADALCDAVRDNDTAAIRAVLGERSRVVVESGDPAEDLAARARFGASCGERMKVEAESPARATLSVGLQEWRFPFPLVKSEARWRFDTRSGTTEVLARRIGRNELAVMQAVLAYVDAQREYALSAHDGVAPGAYAQRIASSAGRHDGLYWEPTREDALSPLGVLFMLADASAALAEPMPYHGYYFRVLTAQGPHAPGGAIQYVEKGRMLGGFGLVAWPARYRVDGVRTFIVSHEGRVYSRDLGPQTAKEAAALNAFDPVPGWRAENVPEPKSAGAPAPANLEKLAADRGCSLCHAPRKDRDPQVVAYGPSYAEIAARYRGDPGAEQALTRTIIRGSSAEHEHWRDRTAFVGMLPNEARTTPDEARALVRWILSDRSAPAQ